MTQKRHKIGDFVIYAEVDSFFPVHPVFEFFRKGSGETELADGSRGFRLKTAKLKGQVSQGIIFPISLFEEFGFEKAVSVGDYVVVTKKAESELIYLTEGQDVSEMFGVKKWEPIIPAVLAAEIKGAFPSFIPKTDEMRIQAVPYILDRYKDVEFNYTEKLDGTSATYYFFDGTFGVCTRNWDTIKNEKSVYWHIAEKYAIEKTLRDSKDYLGSELAIQGELIGPGIQKNKYRLKEPEFRIFTIYDITNRKYVSSEAMKKIADYAKILTVPVFEEPFFLKDLTIDQLVEMSKGKSILSDAKREGLVFRPTEEIYDQDLGRLSFKVINPEFLLKYDE